MGSYSFLKGNTFVHINNLKKPLTYYKIFLNIRNYNTLSDEPNKKNGLAYDVINHFLITLKTNKKIIPKVILSRQGNLASNSLRNMIRIIESRNAENSKKEGNYNRTSNENKLFNFIREYYKLPILVLTKEIDGKLYSDLEFHLPVKIKNSTSLNSKGDDKDSLLRKYFNESGLYIFRHEKGEIALGSAMNFQRRLLDHMNSFNNHRVQEKLHKFVQENGGINSLT
jgi:hypothetical protein